MSTTPRRRRPSFLRRADHLSAQARRRALSRRTFLGGAAATLALPMLEAMLPRGPRPTRAAGPVSTGAVTADGVPRRFLFYYVPNGMHMPHWRPEAVGPGYDLPPILTPLGDLAAKTTVWSGLANKPAIDNVPGDHARGTGSFLTCVQPKKSEGAEIVNGQSIDQVLAEHLGSETAFPSLQLATADGTNIGSCDSGYSCAYSRNISWAGASTPLPKLTSPRVLFDRLFGGVDPTASAADIERRRRMRTSVLDHVVEDVARLDAQLGARDRMKLDEFLTGVYALEQRIADEEHAPECAAPPTPGDELATPELIATMTELMAVALECDLTRVISFMSADGGSNRTFEFLGVSGAHHQLSHHQNKPANLDKLSTIGTWEVAQLAALLARLDSVEEPGGTLLDHTAVYFSSEISDGDRHNHDDLPVLLAGGGVGDALVQGEHRVLDDDMPMANFFMGLAATAGVPLDGFGDDGTDPLDLSA